VVPGTLEPVRDVGEVQAFAERYAYPVAIKAAGGGGGRGLKVARSDEEVAAALESAVREAEAYFGYGAVYLERYLARPKHLEVQILAGAPGQAEWLGVRDCSLQRRHQKLVEETPPLLYAAMATEMGTAAVAVANACGYTNAGTVEFLVDPDAPEATSDRAPFYFLEINARLQVEHTITEEVLGIDLVAAQLRIAAGDPLGGDQDGLTAGASAEPRGHAIECRINAEDPARGFAPGPGRISRYREPGGPGIRVDSGFGEGDEVPAAYDSLIAKLVAWAPTREEARLRMLRALAEFRIEGVPTTISAHRALLEHPEFVDGSYTTVTAEGGALSALEASGSVDAVEGVSESVLMVEGARARLWHPAMAGSVPAATRAAPTASRGEVVSPMHGTILKVLVSAGDDIEPGDPVAILEAMKMETHVASTAAGRVEVIRVAASEVVEAGQVIAVVRPSGDLAP
jgi:acetyl-CoA/propionyl-CoA carboxylase biotin carboxyl carrier protein